MKVETLEYIKSNHLTPENLLPHNLPDYCLEGLSVEAEKIEERVDEENLAEGFVSIVLAINAFKGKRALEHDEIVKDLEVLVKIFSLEKLRRMGLVKSYEEPNLENIFDASREFNVTLAVNS